MSDYEPDYKCPYCKSDRTVGLGTRTDGCDCVCLDCNLYFASVPDDDDTIERGRFETD